MQQQDNNGAKLFVGNLDWSLRDNDLQEAFAAYGSVLEAFIVLERDTGRSKGFGFVTMSSPDEAQAAIAGLDGQMLGAREARVSVAQPPKPRSY